MYMLHHMPHPNLTATFFMFETSLLVVFIFEKKKKIRRNRNWKLKTLPQKVWLSKQVLIRSHLTHPYPITTILSQCRALQSTGMHLVEHSTCGYGNYYKALLVVTQGYIPFRVFYMQKHRCIIRVGVDRKSPTGDMASSAHEQPDRLSDFKWFTHNWIDGAADQDTVKRKRAFLLE